MEEENTIYNGPDEFLDDDAISPEEFGFMIGYNEAA